MNIRNSTLKFVAPFLALTLALAACGDSADEATDAVSDVADETADSVDDATTDEETSDDGSTEDDADSTDDADDDSMEDDSTDDADSTDHADDDSMEDDAMADLPATVVDIATGSDDFSTLVAALTQAGLVETLQGDGPFTVFAPTNAAFEAALVELDITADELLARDDLSDILTYHVLPGKIMAADAIAADGTEIASVQGDTIAITVVDGSVMVDGATVTTADVEAQNGVVHIIDSVILPG